MRYLFSILLYDPHCPAQLRGSGLDSSSALSSADCGGSRRSRTFNLPVNSRTLFQLSYRTVLPISYSRGCLSRFRSRLRSRFIPERNPPGGTLTFPVIGQFPAHSAFHCPPVLCQRSWGFTAERRCTRMKDKLPFTIALASCHAQRPVQKRQSGGKKPKPPYAKNSKKERGQLPTHP